MNTNDKAIFNIILSLEEITVILNALHYYKKVELEATVSQYDVMTIDQVRNNIVRQQVSNNVSQSSTNVSPSSTTVSHSSTT